MSLRKNEEMAEKAFQEFSSAFNKKVINIQKCDISKKLYLHFDQPEGITRFTYAMLSEDKKQVIAVVIIHFSKKYEDNTCKFSIGWCVHSNYRNKKLGESIVKLALDEFTNKIQDNLPSDFYIEANVDSGNIPSNKIANKLLGNKEIIKIKDGLESFSYLKRYRKNNN